MLNEDLSIQNQLVDENAEITKQLNSLCERLESGGDTDDIAFDAMHNELNYIAKEADEFAKRFAEPVRYVLHSVEFSAPEINAKIASTKAEIDSKRARVAADDELKKLQSDISAEMTILEIAVNDGQKVISDDAADLANIDSALQQIRSAMEHLNLAENSYRRMSELPDADAVCSDVLDKLSKYGDELGTLETALVDRQTNLTNFNATALNVKQQLNALENSCNEVEAANVESGLANCDTLAKNLDEVRDNLKELKNEADDLGELKAPNELAESLKEMFDALEERLNKAKDNLLKQKSVEDNVDHELNVAQEELEAFEAKYESPKELATAVEDLKQLNELNVRIGEINVDDVVDRQKQNRFTKRRDELKCLLEELLTPLEKDVAGEQDILAELHNLLAELNSISDKAMAIEGSSDGNGEELANLSKLGDEFDALKNRAEALEEKMSLPEGKVQHSPMDENLSERIMCLERALESKKQQLQTSIKLKALIPAVDSVTESVQSTLKDLEVSLPEKLDEQEATLHDLETKKQELERLVERLPKGDEGDEMRSRALSWLERLNEQLKRLGAVVGDKFAAIAAFIAMRNEVDAQLSSLELEPVKSVDDLPTVSSCNDRAEKLKVRVCID